MPRVTVAASLNMDLVLRVPTFPTVGETVLGCTLERHHGGKGANILMAAAQLITGLDIELVALGMVGGDPFGRELVGALESAAVEVAKIETASAATGVAAIFVGPRGDNQIAVASGANAKVSGRYMLKHRFAIQRSNLFVATLETPIPAVSKAIALASQAGVPVLLNPAPAPKGGLTPRILSRVTYLTPNEGEAETLTGHRRVDESIKALLEQGVKYVLVTRGARGVRFGYLRDDSARRRRYVLSTIPTPRVQAVDTVGAGDAFSGALAVAIAKGLTLEKAVQFAIYVASYSVTRHGAQSSFGTLDEVRRFSRRYRDDAALSF